MKQLNLLKMEFREFSTLLFVFNAMVWVYLGLDKVSVLVTDQQSREIQFNNTEVEKMAFPYLNWNY